MHCLSVSVRARVSPSREGLTLSSELPSLTTQGLALRTTQAHCAFHEPYIEGRVLRACHSSLDINQTPLRLALKLAWGWPASSHLCLRTTKAHCAFHEAYTEGQVPESIMPLSTSLGLACIQPIEQGQGNEAGEPFRSLVAPSIDHLCPLGQHVPQRTSAGSV